MKRPAGLTLLELMVVIAIIGILSATAIPLYGTWRQRTIGSEATVMMKRLLEAEIMYFLANEEFYPGAGQPEIRVWDDGAPPSAVDTQRAYNALNVPLLTGHNLDFRVFRDPIDPVGSPCTVEITSAAGINMFPGAVGIRGTVDKTGQMSITTF